jgi:hypothetical protein
VIVEVLHSSFAEKPISGHYLFPKHRKVNRNS